MEKSIRAYWPAINNEPIHANPIFIGSTTSKTARGKATGNFRAVPIAIVLFAFRLPEFIYIYGSFSICIDNHLKETIHIKIRSLSFSDQPK